MMFDRAYFPTKTLAVILALGALAEKATSQCLGAHCGPTLSADHGAVSDIERGLIGSAENVAPVVFNPTSSFSKGHITSSANPALTINGDKLRRRAPRLTDDLVKIYNSPEYDEAYRNAHKVYQESAPKTKRDPIPFHSYKQAEWLRASLKDLLDWTDDAMDFAQQLHALESNPNIQNDPKKLAIVMQLQDDLTIAASNELNTMVASEGLGYQFEQNKMGECVSAWTPIKVPVLRNTADIDVVGNFAQRLKSVLDVTWGMQMHFARTAKFAGYYDIPRDENDKPLKREAYYIYWRTDTAKPVQDTLVDLHASLDQAKAALKASGLLTNNLRQALDRPDSNSTSLATVGNSIH